MRATPENIQRYTDEQIETLIQKNLDRTPHQPGELTVSVLSPGMMMSPDFIDDSLPMFRTNSLVLIPFPYSRDPVANPTPDSISHWASAAILTDTSGYRQMFYQNSLAGYTPLPDPRLQKLMHVTGIPTNMNHIHNIAVVQQTSADNDICGAIVVENLIAMARAAQQGVARINAAHTPDAKQAAGQAVTVALRAALGPTAVGSSASYMRPAVAAAIRAEHARGVAGVPVQIPTGGIARAAAAAAAAAAAGDEAGIIPATRAPWALGSAASGSTEEQHTHPAFVRTGAPWALYSAASDSTEALYTRPAAVRTRQASAEALRGASVTFDGHVATIQGAIAGTTSAMPETAGASAGLVRPDRRSPSPARRAQEEADALISNSLAALTNSDKAGRNETQQRALAIQRILDNVTPSHQLAPGVSEALTTEAAVHALAAADEQRPARAQARFRIRAAEAVEAGAIRRSPSRSRSPLPAAGAAAADEGRAPVSASPPRATSPAAQSPTPAPGRLTRLFHATRRAFGSGASAPSAAPRSPSARSRSTSSSRSSSFGRYPWM